MTRCTNLVICPYCGWTHPNSIEAYAGDEGVWDQECGTCQKTFRAVRIIDVRVICQKPEDVDKEPIPSHHDILENMKREYAWQIICSWTLEGKLTEAALEERLRIVDPAVAGLVREYARSPLGQCEWCEAMAPLKSAPDPHGGNYSINVCAWGCPP